MTATGPIETSFDVANNWKDGLGMKPRCAAFQTRTYAICHGTNKSRIKTILRRQSCDLEERSQFKRPVLVAEISAHCGIGQALGNKDHADGKTSNDITA